LIEAPFKHQQEIEKNFKRFPKLQKRKLRCINFQGMLLGGEPMRRILPFLSDFEK